MIVELHILQNFAPSCLNRDDTNSPKECLFGGCRRARISSQCIKRSIRWNNVFREMLQDHLSDRSVKFPTQVYEELIKIGTNIDISKEICTGLESIAKKATTKSVEEENEEDIENEEDAQQSTKKDNRYELDIFKTPQMVFYTQNEVNECAIQIKQLIDKGVKTKDILKKNKKGKFINLPIFPIPKSADIALFGRMVTSSHFKDIDAACQVAHAISTHKVGVEFDFYTAVDDLQTEGETGAGMMGTIEFNSACYYRYANIDLGQLKTNLGDNELARKTVEAFIRAAKDAVPSGKQTSFSAQNPPDFVMAVVRDSGTWSLANAFAEPVKENRDLVTKSIEALVEYWNRLNKAYPTDSIKAKPILSLKDTSLDGLQRVNNFEELVAIVDKAIAGDC